MSRGCHHLIRQGACLVENPKQILEELGYSNQSKNINGILPKSQSHNNNISSSSQIKDEKKIMECINRHPTSIDSLVNRSGMKMSLVLSVLFSLELKGIIIGSADGYFKRQPE